MKKLDLLKPLRYTIGNRPVVYVGSPVSPTGKEYEQPYVFREESGVLWYTDEYGRSDGFCVIENAPEEIEMYVNIYRATDGVLCASAVHSSLAEAKRCRSPGCANLGTYRLVPIEETELP